MFLQLVLSTVNGITVRQSFTKNTEMTGGALVDDEMKKAIV
jgi:hypothetical protein